MKTISFAGAARAELCRVPVQNGAAALAEAYGILLFCNHFSAGQVRIVTESPDFAARVTKLFEGVFGVRFDRLPLPPYTGRMVFEISDRSKLQRILEVCEYNTRSLVSIHVNFGLLETDECRAAFLRGAFLAGGSVTDPNKRYHLELSTSHLAVSRELLIVLEECDMRPKIIHRKGIYLCYFKQSGEIARFLKLIGATEGAGLVFAAREEKHSINRANRCSNCDMANLDKTVAAAQEQLLAIRSLEEKNRLQNLPEKLQEAARLRLEYPELSLSQLGELCDPPVSKSSFNYRLKKLMEISEQ